MLATLPLPLRLVFAVLPALLSAPPAVAAGPDLLWGANGHPLAAYGTMSVERQLDHLQTLGMRSYRIDISDPASARKLATLVREAKRRGIDVLPVLTPHLKLDEETPEALRAKAYAFAFDLVSQFKAVIHVWELGNELESYAIIQPCEMQDNGVQYSCSYGPAGGVGPLEYYGPRWAKVSAVLKGLSQGTSAADPGARKAMGTGGWGHVGAFERLERDGIAWDISVWHMYGDDPEWAFKTLARFHRPIWVTEFNHPGGSQHGEEAQGEGLKRSMLRLRALRAAYNVEAAFVYELLDEPYWGSDYEAAMGLVTVERNDEGAWEPRRPKAAYHTVHEVITGIAAPAAAQAAPPAAASSGIARKCDLAGFNAADTGADNQIAYAYCLILGRAADSAGARAHALALTQGGTLEEMLADMLASPEFEQARNVGALGNRQYVTLLYRMLMGRDPDGAGLAGYASRLDLGTLSRAGFSRELLASAEFRTRHPLLAQRTHFTASPAAPAPSTAPAFTRRCDLTRLDTADTGAENRIAYAACLVLGRPADGAGTRAYAAALRDGRPIAAILAEMLASREFEETNAVSSRDDRQYVTLLYQVLMDRNPDGGGLAAYLARLEAKTLTRADLARALIGSQEFRARHPLLATGPQSTGMLDRVKRIVR